jgi:hypothetical protein
MMLINGGAIAVANRYRAILIVTAATAIFLAASPGSSPTAFAQEPDQDLHQLARQAGGKLVLRYLPDRSLIYPNLQELAKRSDIIVVGRTLGHRSRLRGDGKFITKDFWVRVQSVFKGDVPNGKTILVSLPGGSYMFPDKTFIYLNPYKYKQAEDSRTYVFFLKKKGTTYAGHELAAGPQALFDITGRTVEPAHRVPGDPLLVKYKGKRTAMLLAHLESAAGLGKKR